MPTTSTSSSMMKLVRTAATTTTKKGLLRRISPPRPLLASTTTTIHHSYQTRSYFSSLHEASLLNNSSSYGVSSSLSPLGDYEANQYGYRVVVNRSSSSLRSMNHEHHANYDNRGVLHNDYDDYDGLGPNASSRNVNILMEHDNLDILASLEVQAILQSQRDWDLSLQENTMMVKGESLQDTILDGGDDYDSDCEEMAPTDWDDNHHTSRGCAAASEDCWDTAEQVEDN